jgi:HEAT repeat protein
LCGDESLDVRLEAAAALGRLDGESALALSTLQELAQRDDIQPLALATAIDVLGRSQEAASLLQDAARAWLAAEAVEVREAALLAVSRWGAAGRPLIATVLELLEDEDPVVREQAAVAVGQLRPSLAVAREPLEAAAHDEDAAVAAAAQHALQQLSDPP